MARPVTYTPARRFLMQGIMWIILGGTVGLAAIVSHYRKSALETKLTPPITYREVTTQLPKGWEIRKTADPLSSVLLTATEGKSDAEDEAGGRVIRIVREAAPSSRSPIEFAITRLGAGSRNARTISGKDYISINRTPGEVLYQIRQSTPKSLQDLISGGLLQTKAICAATVGPSGRGLSVELDGEGAVDPGDIDLVKRIAATITVNDEPALIESGEVTLENGIRAAIPGDFAAVKDDDAMATVRTLRGENVTGPMRSIALLPITILPKDSGPTLLTILSLFDLDFEEATMHQDDSGVWRADVDAGLRQLLPLRAFAMSKNGQGVMAVFRGGDDDSWIDDQWKGIQEKLTFPEESNVSELAANGASAAKQLADNGLTRFLPESTDDLWWLLCLHSPDQAMGWRKYSHGANAGRTDTRYQFDTRLFDAAYDWRGTMDVKSYRVSATFAQSDSRQGESQRTEKRIFSATSRGGKVELSPTGAGKPVSYSAPPNYIPGGWLPLVMGKLVDRPMIVRTESFLECAYLEPRDLLTVTLRPEPDAARPTDDSHTPMHCISLEVSGTGEKSRWFYREDGTLDGVDYMQGQHLIRSDEHDVTMAFSHNDAMRP